MHCVYCTLPCYKHFSIEELIVEIIAALGSLLIKLVTTALSGLPDSNCISSAFTIFNACCFLS